MNLLLQILIIFGSCFAGEALRYILPFRIPASIYGMLILFTLLLTKKVKPDDIRPVSSFLLNIMLLLFVPAGVGLMAYWNEIKLMWWQLLIVIVISTVCVFGVSGLVTQGIIRKGEKK